MGQRLHGPLQDRTGNRHVEFKLLAVILDPSIQAGICSFLVLSHSVEELHTNTLVLRVQEGLTLFSHRMHSLQRLKEVVAALLLDRGFRKGMQLFVG